MNVTQTAVYIFNTQGKDGAIIEEGLVVVIPVPHEFGETQEEKCYWLGGNPDIKTFADEYIEAHDNVVGCYGAYAPCRHYSCRAEAFDTTKY